MTRPVRPTPEQKLATDPAASAWVSANAGSGKTFVLVLRVLRLLLQGADPAQILCLTFTRAAAAEMSGRVFAILAGWTTRDDAALAEELAGIEGAPPSPPSDDAAAELGAPAAACSPPLHGKQLRLPPGSPEEEAEKEE